jgi:hypothetical protein
MTSRVSRRRPVKIQLAGRTIELDAPGLKTIRRGLLRQFYWVKDDGPDFKGYETKTVRIHLDETDPDAAERIKEICRREQAAMLEWADGHVSDKSRLAPKYNGTMGSLIDLYQWDDESAFEGVKHTTKQNYSDWLKVVRETIGLRRLDRMHPKNFRKYYKNWRKPTTPVGEERVRRAYGCIQMVRVALSYGIEADLPDCKRLRDGLTRMSFEKNPPREEIMTFAQADAIVRQCIDAGDISTALVQSIQYDCMLRQNDVIGQWRPEPSTYVLKAGEVRRGIKVWSGMTIDLIQVDRDLVVRTSKTSQPVVHAIDKCGLVMRCVALLDRSDPMRPVASRPDGKPWPDRQAFAKVWRKHATAAGVPKAILNMDNRASGITEAAAAGVSDDDIANTAAHDKRVTRGVYKRKARQISERVQAARQGSRTGGEEK